MRNLEQGSGSEICMLDYFYSIYVQDGLGGAGGKPGNQGRGWLAQRSDNRDQPGTVVTGTEDRELRSTRATEVGITQCWDNRAGKVPGLGDWVESDLCHEPGRKEQGWGLARRAHLGPSLDTET